MGNTLRTVRVRSGMYITPDGQYRIVRRLQPITNRKRWWVQRWDSERKYFADQTSYTTLARARKALVRVVETLF